MVVAAICWWLIGSGADNSDGLPDAQRAKPAAGALPSEHTQTNTNADAVLAARLTQPAKGVLNPLLNPRLKLTFEAMLLEAGTTGAADGTPELLKQRLAVLIPRYFSPEWATDAFAVLQRYVDYRVALGKLATPADASDPRSLRQALDARQAVRKRYFSPEEHDALFAQDDALDRFTVARLEIERNTQLTPAQKQAALQQVQAELSPAEQVSRGEVVAHIAVAAQTAAFDSNNTSAQERYQQRSRAHGDAAAQRLAASDLQERDWQTRLGQYAGALASQSDPAQGQQLQQLRDQLFSSQEQLRLDAALAARAGR